MAPLQLTVYQITIVPMTGESAVIAARRKALSGIAVLDVVCDELRLAALDLERRYAADLAAAREADRASRMARDPADKRPAWVGLGLQALRADREHVSLRWSRTVPVSASEKRIRYVSIPSRDGDYNLKTLCARAPTFMHAIVTDVEHEARALRSAWREARKLRSSIRSFAEPGWRLRPGED